MSVITTSDLRGLVIESFEDEPHLAAIELPPLTSTGVRIGLRAASINAFDWKVATGALSHAFEYDFPVTIGRDYAGVVLAVGEGVSRVAVGHPVFGYLGGQTLHRGAFATELYCDEEECFVAMPAELSFEQAACLPLCGVVAWRCVEAVTPTEGALVLVVGAPGGVGTYAVQLAAARGAQVIATGRDDDADYLYKLGAVDVVPPDDSLIGIMRDRYPAGIDGLIDVVHFRPQLVEYLDLLRDGGRVASTHRSVDDADFKGRDLSGVNVHSGPDRDLLTMLAREAADGRLVTPIDTVFEFAELPSAVAAAQQRHSRGRLVVRLQR
jgi:NADPH:quinone reductase-like Zn-dependent oxidoreductase